jgi:hypothetical protein
MQDQHSDFLIALGALRTPHSGRTLYEHLKGVHDLLRDWDNDEIVCLAGLFHSIYGTEAFKHVSLVKREALIEVIGHHAEHLVHLFSEAKDRPLFESVDNPKWRSQLMEIEAANLVEQESGSDKKLKLLSRQNISAHAKVALMMQAALT